MPGLARHDGSGRQIEAESREVGAQESGSTRAALPLGQVGMPSLPNLLTLSRIVAVPLLVGLLWWPAWTTGYALAFALYCLMGITDYFDGYLARSNGAVSRLGVFLDPIADKIMVASVILMLVGTRDIQGVHLIAALVILLREIAVSGLREFLAPLHVSVPVSKLAKWKTTLQLVSLGGLILAGAAPAALWIETTSLAALWGAAVLTLVTGWDYLRVGLKHMD
ncbi:CDP-diacylglycerol--glycerol-3-phosphate 3-phosphatidyltransferase [Sphingomonas rubra]|uniref:CDP-diacylglycerol--glycerol-3-phosphate 3-phosphatidyltransferase n=2 Tax=Sphingomonas rubra TaxID=634430 RepID=A0A1I5QPI7_9SPHN|nr:CDP-diacylglycerol--glycerol-3-phosphate 3-phosphatidyltransferase [Sphingomonas rubra]